MSKLKSLVTAGLIGLAGLGLMPEKAEAQVSGNVEYVQSEVNEASYARPNLFYNLPGDVSGYTFMEFYKGGDGYFGRTMLDKGIGEGFQLRALNIHANEPWSETGVGLQRAIPGLPENVFLKTGIIPFWVGNDGDFVGDKTMAQYFFSINDLPLGLSADGFGEWNLNTGEWGYGEAALRKQFGPVTLSLNPALLNDGDAIPSIQHRVAVGVNINK